VHCPWTTTRRLRVWVCWQSLQVEYTGSFLVFNRACLLASVCPTWAIPAVGPAFVNLDIPFQTMSCNQSRLYLPATVGRVSAVGILSSAPAQARLSLDTLYRPEVSSKKKFNINIRIRCASLFRRWVTVCGVVLVWIQFLVMTLAFYHVPNGQKFESRVQENLTFRYYTTLIFFSLLPRASAGNW
jgi:hypothetical protein